MTQTVDLRPQRVTIKVRRGDRWSLSVTYPGSLVGKIVRGQVRPDEDAPDEQATDLLIEITDAAAGKFDYGQEAAYEGVYDIEIVSESSGLGRTWLAGEIRIEGDVTRV